MEKKAKLMTSQEAQKWIMWTNIFVIVDGAAHTAYAQVSDGKVKFALNMMHRALKEVDKSFADVANALNEGKVVPSITLPILEIDDWDMGSGLSGGIIEILTGAVSTIISRIGPDTKSEQLSMVLRALSGLLVAFDNYKREINKTDRLSINIL